jgi:hypothetical protein
MRRTLVRADAAVAVDRKLPTVPLIETL